jgi:ribonuclease HI
MARLFEPEEYGWTNSILPNQILIPNSRGTFFNIEDPDGGFFHDIIGLYIDGACLANGTPWAKAGVGVYFGPRSQYNNSQQCPKSWTHTSQRAELYAAITALEIIDDHIASSTTIDTFVIVSDSAYLVNSITNYIYRWQNNGWITTAGKDVANQDMWENLDDRLDAMLDSGVNVLFWKCDRSENTEADRLARLAVEIDNYTSDDDSY